MRYVALLRGIGPGNPNMRNDKLRGALEKLGYQNVQTVISSGNVLFETSSRAAKALETTIEQGIEDQLGFFSTTIIRSHRQLQRLVEDVPFGEAEDGPTTRLNVTFLKNKPATNLRTPLHLPEKGYSVVHMQGREVFSVVDTTGGTTPDLMAWLEKQFGKEITTRTWKTVGHILKKLDG